MQEKPAGLRLASMTAPSKLANFTRDTPGVAAAHVLECVERGIPTFAYGKRCVRELRPGPSCFSLPRGSAPRFFATSFRVAPWQPMAGALSGGVNFPPS